MDRGDAGCVQRALERGDIEPEDGHDEGKQDGGEEE